MKQIWRVFVYLKYFPKQVALNILFNMLAVSFNLCTFVMIIPFVELLFGIGQPPAVEPQLALNQQALMQWMDWYLWQKQSVWGVWPCLLGVSAIYLSCSFLSNGCRYLGQFFIDAVRTGIAQHMRDDVYHKVTILPVSFFTAQRKGDIISRMSNDLTAIEWGVLTSIVSLGKDPLNILLFSGTLIFVSPRLFLYFLMILPVSVWLIGLIGKRLKQDSERGQSRLGGLFAVLEESLAGIRAIKSFGQEQGRYEVYRKSNDRYTDSMVRVSMRRELSSPLSEVLATIGLVAILVLGGLMVFDGALQASVFVFFVIIFARLIPPVQSIVRVYNNLQKAEASAERFFEIMDADEVIVEKPNAFCISQFEHQIEYCGVSFAYQESASDGDANYVLRQVDLVVPKGKTVAVVGPSGAGKTTLVDLLPRFYDCTEGDILLDGNSVRDLNINSLRSLVGLVSQNCVLFNDTVANNIAFGRPDYSREEIRQAAHVAYADEFIDQLEQGYDTPIGDRGLNLSGGQRQRLSIARAVLKDPPILILDEATSALDTESEHCVQQALDQLMQGRTSIVIAHRLSTIYKADMIVVMDQGRIVERGTHEQLLAQDGLYKKLVDMQSFR